MPQYVDANSLQNVQDYLNGAFDTQLFRSLCVDIIRFLPSRYVPDKRTMQANRDRFERKRLLQVCGELDFDSPLLSASKTDQKRKASPTTTKDWSDKKRVKSTKKTSPASTFTTTVPVHSQCTRPGCVSRGISVTHTHAQHTPSAFTIIKTKVSLLRPASWPRRLTPLLARSLQAPLP